MNKVELLCRIKSLLRVRHLKNQLDRTLAYLAEFESAIRRHAILNDIDRRNGMSNPVGSPGWSSSRGVPRGLFFGPPHQVFVTSIGRVEEASPSQAGEEYGRGLQPRREVRRRAGLFNPTARSGSGSTAGTAARSTTPSWAAQVETGLGSASASTVLRLPGPSAGYRLISSEADGLSGLTVDRYDRWLVAQFTSLALFQRREHPDAGSSSDLTSASEASTRRGPRG